jgi:hypothetical protein
MRRTRISWFLAVTGVLACPCHLVITLPLAVALLGGTALGGWIATHEGAVALGAALYFVGALTLGATLLLARTRAETVSPEGMDEAAAAASRETVTCLEERFGEHFARARRMESWESRMR